MTGHGTPAARRRHPTLADVARHAGVSLSTVNLVLARSPRVRSSTAALVHAAIRDLNYRGDPAARALRTGTTHVLGVVVENLGDPMRVELVQAIDRAAAEAGNSVLLGIASDDRAGLGRELVRMARHSVDGLLVISAGAPEALLRERRGARPAIVMVNAARRIGGISHIGSDERGGGDLAGAHLIELGHRNVAYVRGASDSATDRLRLSGFRHAWRTEYPTAPGVVELPGGPDHLAGLRAAASLIADRWRGTAIACHNDRVAAGVVRGLALAGLRVPADVSVIALEGLSGQTWFDPPLTAVVPRSDEIAILAVRQLLHEVASPHGSVTAVDVRLPMKLRIGGSTARATESAS